MSPFLLLAAALVNLAGRAICESWDAFTRIALKGKEVINAFFDPLVLESGAEAVKTSRGSQTDFLGNTLLKSKP